MSAAIKRALLPTNVYEEPGLKVSLLVGDLTKGSRVPARKKTVPLVRALTPDSVGQHRTHLRR
jgi:hypothetical protein